MIRLAENKDLNQVACIYDDILDYEEQTVNYTTWLKGKYPTIKDAEKSFSQGTLFVGEEGGKLWGSVILNDIQLPEYGKIPWKTKTDKVLVIHTLCISPRFWGKGKASEFVLFTEELARGNGYGAIRLDTYEGNVPANKLYSKLGYSYAGNTEFFFQGFIHEILNCYEKKI